MLLVHRICFLDYRHLHHLYAGCVGVFVERNVNIKVVVALNVSVNSMKKADKKVHRRHSWKPYLKEYRSDAITNEILVAPN